MKKDNWTSVGKNHKNVLNAEQKQSVDWAAERSKKPFTNTTSVRVSYMASKSLVTKK